VLDSFGDGFGGRVGGEFGNEGGAGLVLLEVVLEEVDGGVDLDFLDLFCCLSMSSATFSERFVNAFLVNVEMVSLASSAWVSLMSFSF